MNWTPYILLCMLIIQKWNTIESYFKKVRLFNKQQYELQGKLSYNIQDAYMYGDLSTHMWAVLYNIHRTIQTSNIPIKKVRTVEFPYNKAFEQGEYVHIPSENDKIWVTADIYCVIHIRIKDYKSKSFHYEGGDRNVSDSQVELNEINITLTSTKSIESIIQYIKTVTDAYDAHIKTKDNDKLFIIKPKCSTKDTYCGFALEIPFKSTKAFDNLFFEGKEDLIGRLDTFVKRDKYKVLGLPETLGLLFYGEPGTGKTSAIKAVANYLSMHLIIVPMSVIKTKRQLEELFFDTSKEIRYPNDKRIYVFEEIDCNGWENISTDRKNIGAIGPTSSLSAGEAAIANTVELLTDSIKSGIGIGIGIGADAKKKKEELDDKLTLGAILEVIDGLVETPGRVIIFTTNHKDSIDPALLRPGRIDMQIEFRKLRRSHIQQIFQKWYGYPICHKSLQNIPDYKFTQAEVSQLLFKYQKNSNAFLEEVCRVKY